MVDSMKKIIFDVGANHGIDSIPRAQEDIENTIVYAFEPTPFLIDVLKHKASSLSNYIIVEKAVSDFNGTAKFNVAGNDDWGCSSLLEFSEQSFVQWPGRTDFSVTDIIEVEVIRLDNFISQHNISQIDYLHIDTQGSDLKVLHGLGQYIDLVKEGLMEAAYKKDILYKNQNTVEDSVEFLKQHGFSITAITSNDIFNNEANIRFVR